MKRLTLFLALVLGVGLSTAQAQKCSKAQKAACAKSQSAAVVDKGHCSGSADAAAKLASLDDSIESRTCATSGNVSYVRKVVNQDTGEASFTDVTYDSELGKFVNVSPSAAKACCAKGVATGCCAGKKGVKTAETESTAPTPEKASIQKKS